MRRIGNSNASRFVDLGDTGPQEFAALWSCLGEWRVSVTYILVDDYYYNGLVESFYCLRKQKNSMRGICRYLVLFLYFFH